MQVITLAQVKEQLGITSSDYDTAITAKLPIIDAKVKLICKNNFNYRFAADLTNGSNIIAVYALVKSKDYYPSGVNNFTIMRDVSKSLEIGMQVEGDNIPTGTYITNFYKSGSTDIFGINQDAVYVELSENATADANGDILTGGISIAYQDIIAKGVQFLLNGTSTNLPESPWTSKSMGPLSVGKGSSSESIDGLSGMPLWFVKGLPRYQ